MVIVVKSCAECPFCTKLENGTQKCNVTFPPYRVISTEDKVPVWCPFKKEQIIVRNFS